MGKIFENKKLKPYRLNLDTIGNYAIEKRIKTKRTKDRKATANDPGYKKGDKYIHYINEGYFVNPDIAIQKIARLKAEAGFKEDVINDITELAEAFRTERKKLKSITL